MKIVPKWKKHSLTKAGVVELVPTDWLFQLYGPDVTPEADLKDGSIVDMETLWKNIREKGLYDPIILRVGTKNKKFRLEAGNHRIQVLKKHGVKYAPAVVQIQDECGPHVANVMTNATHNFDFNDDVITPNIESGYLKPSSVFKSLSLVKPF